MESDADLIQSVLSGDDDAFTTLVRRHQKSVHALAWRQTGDFHCAEEIAQDVFLRAYKGLPKLKNPNLFPGWLYVITYRQCNTWLAKNKLPTESIENISAAEIQEISYEHYMSAEREKEAKMSSQKLVEQLLEKLPESERTVVTLYYLGEMSTKEISKFLGVSVNTITSRLQRGRARLKEHENILVQEVLGGVQLSNNFVDNIAQKVADVELTPPVNWKPFVPWMAFGTAVLLILLLAASNQYLLRFQKPYSFEAESERTVEIIDAPIVLDSDAKPAVRTQAGRDAATDRNNGDGVQVSESIVASNTQNELIRTSASRWTQTSAPKGGSVSDVFATSKGVLFAFSPAGIYRLAADATAWILVTVDVPPEAFRVPMTEHDGVLYLVSKDAVFASTDDGETWSIFCTRPVGDAIGLVITDGVQKANKTLYLVLKNKGVFSSTDAGESWTHLDDGLTDRMVSKITAVGNTVFAGTDSGLYRLDAGVWERLMDVPGSIYSLAVSEGSLYVGTGPDFRTLQQTESKSGKIVRGTPDNNLGASRVFHSADFGASWAEITPMGGSHPIALIGMSLSVVGKTILAQAGTQFRSTDGGQTWVDLGLETNSSTINTFLSVAVSERTFYKAGTSGIYRTTDSGKSWHLFMDGMVGTGIQDLAAVNNRLYVHTDGDIVQSTDRGASWEAVSVNTKPFKEEGSRFNFFGHSRLTIADNILYVISPGQVLYDVNVFRLSTDGNALVPIQAVPAFEAEQEDSSEVPETDDDLSTPRRRKYEIIGAFVVSGGTFYTEYQRKLFKWKPGDSSWKDTGLADTDNQSEGDLADGFRLAVSGETVYAGKRNGRLLQSLDGGNSWKDITPNLPLRFTCFKEIAFAGSTVYVATDAGVLASQTGGHWRVINDDVVIDRFAVDGLTVYGAGDTGVYRLDVHSDWTQIFPGVPGKVRSLVVDRNRLYVATEQRGMFHISLDENNYLVNQ